MNRRTCFTSTHSSTRFFENSCLKSPAMITCSAFVWSNIWPRRSRITRRWNRGIETPCSASAPSKPRWRSEITRARSLRRNSAKSRVASTPFATLMRSTAFRKTSNTDKGSPVAAWRGSLRTSSPHRFGSCKHPDDSPRDERHSTDEREDVEHHGTIRPGNRGNSRNQAEDENDDAEEHFGLAG